VLKPSAMNRLALALCFLSLAAVAQPVPDAGVPAPSAPEAPVPPPEPPRPTEAPDDTSCPDSFSAVEEPTRGAPVLAPVQVDVDGRGLTPTVLELRGLQRLTQVQVRDIVGAPAPDDTRPLSAAEAQSLPHRLARTGLFARVEPRIRVDAQGPARLEITLEEYPTLTSVEFVGLEDLQPRELQESLLAPPPRFSPDDDAQDSDEEVATFRFHKRRGTLTVARPCPAPRPPERWLARMDGPVFRTGLLLGGVDAALERVLNGLRDNDGYLLATVSAVLSADGRLVVTVDEGRLESVDIQGVDPEIAARVREALELSPGDVFLRSDARRAMERMESRLPFLRASKGKHLREHRVKARVVEELETGGARHFVTREEARPEPKRREKVEFETSGWWLFHGDNDDARSQGLSLEGKRLVVHVRPRPPDLDVDLLPVHTQVTGFAPGLSARLSLFDGKDRVHTTLEGAFFIPLRWGGQRLPDDPEGTRRQRRVNLLGGAKVRLPALGLAELGAQAHDFTDTLDRWRLGDFDSYFYSFLINRPDRDYFRRQGFTAFATWRFARTWLAGVEVRGDTMGSLQAFTPPLSLFRRDSAPFTNAPVNEGRFRSAVARLEYSSGAEASTRVGSLYRTPETALFERTRGKEHDASVRGFVTMEVGEGPGATGADTRFWKLVGDVAMDLPVSHHTGLSLRLRAAAGHDLPLQKQEALGGWSGLRGYGFKEFRGGDSSVLASAEYRWHGLGVFADLGSVHAASAWTDAKLGLGASFHFSDNVRFEAAWRIDDQARATPEARLFFVRTF
jgi:hypothetical protein